jgi:uncharacterized protein DUF4345
MRGARIFLGFSTLVWLPYGLFCFFQPGYLHDAAGVAIASTTGRIELRAMYGGLQAAIGLLALGGMIRTTLTRPALTTLAFLCAGLASTRTLGALVDGELSSYTAMALMLEWTSTVVAARLLRKGQEPRAIAR